MCTLRGGVGRDAFPVSGSGAAATAKPLQLCPTLHDPTDGSPPGSAVPGILQARILEWVVISFSDVLKWKGKVKLLSHVWLLATPWTAAYQAAPSFPGESTGMGFHCLLRGSTETTPICLSSLTNHSPTVCTENIWSQWVPLPCHIECSLFHIWKSESWFSYMKYSVLYLIP